MKKFDNYRKNLDVLRRSDQQDLNNEFIISGIIDKFSIQFELGWKVLKELLTYEGIDAAKTGSPREIIKLLPLHRGRCMAGYAVPAQQYGAYLRWKCRESTGTGDHQPLYSGL